MADEDRARWDARYAGGDPVSVSGVALPRVFADFADQFPVSGVALDLACGQGFFAVWLARRGLDVRGVDISPVAIERARDLARECGVADHCGFDVVDLDNGLPSGPKVDVLVCHNFRDSRLDPAIAARLVPGGLLAIVALSEVGASAGPYRVAAGELPRAFAEFSPIASGEGDGRAWLLARR